MIIVIFRSRLREGVDREYPQMAAHMLELVAQQPGFISFKSFSAPDGERVSISEFQSEEAVAAWRSNMEHSLARAKGRDSFYQQFKVQVCTPVRAYEFEFKE